MEEKNKRKGIIYLVIGLVTLLILVVGATYAYFQAQSGEGQSANVNVSTSTTDSLTFTLTDINVTDNNNVKDENNSTDDGNDNTDIVINATQDNFGEKNTSLGDGVSAKATLMANSDTKIATKNYNVYLVLDLNELKYTTEEQTPELILTVTEPGESNPTQTIETQLAYHTKDEENARDISGFDITGKRAVIEIANGYEIKANDTEATTQEWKVQVTLVNLKENQNENTGKSITGKVVITADKVEELTDINTVTLTRAADSIIAKVDKEGLKDYYFKIDGGTAVSTIALGSEDEWEHETTQSHTFNTLQEETEYTISAYGVDENGYKTNVYETKVTTGDGELPSITNVTVNKTTYNSIEVNVTATGDPTNYEYEISGAALTEPTVVTNDQSTYTFTGLAEQQQYTIKVRAIDGEGNKSADYEITASTGKMPLAIKCQDKTAQCLADNYSADSTLYYHDGNTSDSGSEKEAGDYSYRYSGANYKIADRYAQDYNAIDNDLIKFKCNGSDQDIESWCSSSYAPYYYLAYDEKETQYTTYGEAASQALKEGYLETVVNNYVCFGGDCSSDPAQDGYKYLYRIIGLFKNGSDQYEMKIIKADYATETDLGGTGIGAYKGLHGSSSSTYKGDKTYLSKVASYYWNSTDGTSSSANNVNMWKESNLNKVNLNQTFYNAIESTYQGMIEKNHEWQVGGTLNIKDAKAVYEAELGENKLTAESQNCYDQGDTSTKRECNQENDLTYQANVGLMYISDYMYGTLPEYWTTTSSNYDQDEVKNNNWLYLGLSEWTITRASFNGSSARYVTDEGNTHYYDVNRYGLEVRPVLYLTSNTKISSGSGTAEDPMKLEIE